MAENNVKLEIKIGEISIALEGDKDFVSEHYDKIEKQLENFVNVSKITQKISQEKTHETNDTPKTSESESDGLIQDIPNSFGQWLNIIPRETSDTDKALLAGYFTQLNSDSGTFRSRDVSKLLKEHGIKLSNVSVFVKSLAKTKKIFQDSKTGNEANYKVSRTTEESLKELLKQ